MAQATTPDFSLRAGDGIGWVKSSHCMSKPSRTCLFKYPKIDNCASVWNMPVYDRPNGKVIGLAVREYSPENNEDFRFVKGDTKKGSTFISYPDGQHAAFMPMKKRLTKQFAVKGKTIRKTLIAAVSRQRRPRKASTGLRLRWLLRRSANNLQKQTLPGLEHVGGRETAKRWNALEDGSAKHALAKLFHKAIEQSRYRKKVNRCTDCNRHQPDERQPRPVGNSSPPGHECPVRPRCAAQGQARPHYFHPTRK